MSGSTAPEDPIKQRDFYVMVGHVTLPLVLMLPAKNGWTLPYFTPEERSVLNAGHIIKSTRSLLGLETTLLRCVYLFVDREVEMRTEAVFAMENHSPDWQLPAAACWVGSADLVNMELAIPGHRRIIEERILEEETGRIPPQRQPWARKGWLPTAVCWIREELARTGIEVTGEPEQDKTWSISCLLRVPTSEGTVYFKAVPKLFAQEPLITKSLAGRFPSLVPMPLAIKVDGPEQSWMLLRDIGGVEMRDDASPQQWEGVLLALSQIQQDSISDTVALLASGYPDRRLERLIEHIDTLFDDPESVGQLDSVQIEKLKVAAPALKEMCAQLAGYGIQQTLIHGDFHGGNVMMKGESCIIFDWTDACISHPFFDLATLFEFDMPHDQQHIQLDGYLNSWVSFETKERLVEAYKLSEPLSMLHHAVSYRSIVATLEPDAKWEMFGGSTPWLRSLIEWIDEHAVGMAEGAGVPVGLS